VWSSSRPAPIIAPSSAAGVPFVKVNPRQARHFAEAIGKLAKTDRLGAAILARMGAMLEFKTRPPQSEALLELKELLTNLAQEGWGLCR
jgi:transposase